MADYNTAEISAGRGKVGGIIFSAPAGSTLPTDASTALDAAFVNLGYIADDAIGNTYTVDSEQIREHDGKVVLVAATDVTDEFTWSMLQVANPDVLKQVYGDAAVTVTGVAPNEVVTVVHNGSQRPAREYVIELTNKRIVIPNGMVSANTDVSYERGAAQLLGVTVTALPDASGNSAYEYFA